MTAAPFRGYRVAPFSGGDAGSEGYRRNMRRPSKDPDAWPCAICGRPVALPVHPTKERIWRGVNTDLTWAPEGENGSQGCFVVGFDCDKKYRLEA